jgi:hypothetical protein
MKSKDDLNVKDDSDSELDNVSDGESDNISDGESDSESIDDELNQINTQITTKSICAIYHEYLKEDKLLLSPEYQRDLCWSVDKMILFIDTIMKEWIVPNYVIYKLTSTEAKNNEHSYECIDGQHRLTSIKWFMEGIRDPITKKYVYYKLGKERIFYSLTNDQLLEVKKNMPKHYKIRNFTKIEKNIFDDYQMSFHIISCKNGLKIQTKCSIFNRLQNGERVASYEKLKNNPNNIITNCIRNNQLLKYMNDIKFIDIIDIKKMKKYEGFNIYFLIRTFLIIDKKNLDVNYLDLNIKKYLESNDGNGSESVRLKNDITNLLEKVLDIINFISSNKSIVKKIIPELAYIYICIYANYGKDMLDKVLKSMVNNTKDYNKITSYKTSVGKVTSLTCMNTQYESLINDYINGNLITKNTDKKDKKKSNVV